MHLCGLAPEGPARPEKALHPSPGGVAAQALAQADGTRFNTLILLLKGGIYLETGKYDSIGKVQVPTDSRSHSQQESGKPKEPFIP
jgi:hypothetical protein